MIYDFLTFPGMKGDTEEAVKRNTLSASKRSYKKHEMFTQLLFNVRSPPSTLAQHWSSIERMLRVWWVLELLHSLTCCIMRQVWQQGQQTLDIHPRLAQCWPSWSNIEPTLDECFVFAGVEVDPTRLPISAHFDADHPSYPRLSPNVWLRRRRYANI